MSKIYGLFVAFAAAWILMPVGADAAVSPSPCPGNLCEGTVIVGGQTVRYTYTEHVNPNGRLRIRLNGGTYNTPDLISYLLSGVPVFSSWTAYPNPDNGAIILPEQEVNPGRTAYERRSSFGLSSEIVDMVMEVSFSGLAPGSYAYNIMVIQNGDSGAKTNIRFYVDPAAPMNNDESISFAAVPGMNYPCADSYDNDLNFDGDCSDALCNGEIGDVVPGALCEAPEMSCADSFDNDADGLPDCLDSDCDGRLGEFAGTGLCQYPNEKGVTSCNDAFDNDGDGLIDCVDNSGGVGERCWKEATYGCPAIEDCSTAIDDDKDESYGSDWDLLPTTGVNCLDYDCHGDPACPAEEGRDKDGVPKDTQCFDGIDNDLDTLIDCSDPDCLGSINPNNTAQRCYDDEFNLGLRYQLCNNAFDDNGNTFSDCEDLSCQRRFGNCGPCPEWEDLVFDACTNGIDEDSDGQTDCEDADCGGHLMTLDNAAFCATSENTADLCSDLADNDGNGLTDCEEPSCLGLKGHDGQKCENPETTCDDFMDNDDDDYRDCVDSTSCYGVGSCAAKDWVDAPCRIVPIWSGPTPFVSNDPTVFADSMITSHAGDPHKIIFTGSSVYESVTIIVGDNTDPGGYFPYSESAPGCQLTDTTTGLPAARFDFLAVSEHAVLIYSTTGPDIDTFDITLTCDTPLAPALPRDYPASISVLRRDGVIPEYGDIILTTELLESMPPIIKEIEPEAGIEPSAGVNGRLDIPVALDVGSKGRRFRAVPEDQAPAYQVCSCEIEVNGYSMTTGPECVSPQVTFSRDNEARVRSYSEDGSGNVGSWSPYYYFDVNVTPAIEDDLVITGPSKPFFRTLLDQNKLSVSAKFVTGEDESFGGTCEVYVRTLSGSVIGGPPGPTDTFAGYVPVVGNSILCEGAITLPTDTMADGAYFVSVRVTDDDTDGAGGVDRADSIETSRQIMYVCNNVPKPGDADPNNGCIWADFDRDGVAEGLYTNLYTLDTKACDNCVGLPNHSQIDANANGFGDACEPGRGDEFGVLYGRCYVDRDVVCQCDSDGLCGYRCPGPSIKDDPDTGSQIDPQQCIEDWGICSIDGTVCFNDLECLGGIGPDGGGLCADGSSCRREQDCIDNGVTPPLYSTSACTGADVCESLLYPWLQTVYGNMFSRKKIIATDPPPDNQFNATFCITARDTILNFVSQGDCSEVDIASRYTFPTEDNQYTTVLGTIDVAGIRAGRRGEVIEVKGTKLDNLLSSYGGQLNGKVILVEGDATISSQVFKNAAMGEDGSGTIFIDGGNLTITGNMIYDSAPADSIRSVASIGWIILDDGSDLKGNLYIDRNVTKIVGAFFVGGKDGIWSVAPPDTEGENQLLVYGLMIGRQFHFSRSYKSLVEGAETVVFDGRAVANPPPGFEDLGKVLPRFVDSAP